MLERKPPLKHKTQTRQPSRPTHLYKYKYIDNHHPEHSGHIFTHNELYFCAPEAFNDPFECAFQVKFSSDKRKNKQFANSALKNQCPTMTRKDRRAAVRNEQKIFKNPNYPLFVQQVMRKGLNKWGVCCLSEIRDSVLMWSHYADKHHGFCLEFSTEEFYVRLPGNRVTPSPVHYTEQYPIAQIIEEVAVKETMLTKAKPWAYEKEWRIITPERTGLHPFPAYCLTGVIFGCRMPEEHQEMIREWCRNREPDLTYYEARESEDSYSLNIVEIS